MHSVQFPGPRPAENFSICQNYRPLGTGWKLVPGELEDINIKPGADTPYGTSQGRTYVRTGVTPNNLMGTGWVEGEYN